MSRSTRDEHDVDECHGRVQYPSQMCRKTILLQMHGMNAFKWRLMRVCLVVVWKLGEPCTISTDHWGIQNNRICTKLDLCLADTGCLLHICTQQQTYACLHLRMCIPCFIVFHMVSGKILMVDSYFDVPLSHNCAPGARWLDNWKMTKCERRFCKWPFCILWKYGGPPNMVEIHQRLFSCIYY